VITQEAPLVQPRETAFGGEEEAAMNIKPMQPLLRGYTPSGPSMHISCMGESYQFVLAMYRLNNKKFIQNFSQKT
jgi:hypothetical protein